MTDYTGIALVLSATLAPTSVIAVAFINGRKLNQVHDVANEALQVSMQVDAAVNGKAPGESSISQDITAIREKQEFDKPTVPVMGVDMPTAVVDAALLSLVRQLAADMKSALAKLEK